MKKIMIIIAVVTAVATNKTMAQNSSLQPVVSAYLSLKNMLAKDNADSAMFAAKNLFKNINDVPMEKLTSNERKVWMKLQKDLSYDAEHIKSTDKIDHQREHFAKLSQNMYKMIKVLNLNIDIMYYQFCPMAEEGKGAYWISEIQTIKNPYMGRKMPTCGSIKETLKNNTK